MRIWPLAIRLGLGFSLVMICIILTGRYYFLPRLEEELVLRLQSWVGRMSIALHYESVRPSWAGIHLEGIRLSGRDIQASGSAEVKLSLMPDRTFLSPRRIVLKGWNIRWQRSHPTSYPAAPGPRKSPPPSTGANSPSISSFERILETFLQRGLDIELQRANMQVLDTKRQETASVSALDFNFSSSDQSLQVTMGSLRYRTKEVLRAVEGQLLLPQEGQRYSFLLTAHDTGDLPWQVQGSLKKDFDSFELRHKRQGIPASWRRFLRFVGPEAGLQLLIKLSAQGLRRQERLNFDVQLASNNLELKHDLLGEVPWGPFPFSLRAKGDLELETGALRLNSGLAHLVAHKERSPIRVFFQGEKSDLLAPMDQQPLRLSINLPETPCQIFLDALPAQAFPFLHGFTLQGTLSSALEMQLIKKDAPIAQLGAQTFGCQLEKIPESFSRERLITGRTQPVANDQESGNPAMAALKSTDFVPLSEIPEAFLQGLISAEDGGFWQHEGFRWRALQAALQANLKAGRVVYGASTLTMQLVKNLYLSHERVLSRKIQELYLAWALEQILSKEEILEIYANIVEFGPDMRGIWRASQGYFGKKPRDLSVAESLYLASILPSPHRSFASHYCSGQLDEGIVKRMQKTAEGITALAGASFWQRELQTSLKQLHFPVDDLRQFCKHSFDIGLKTQAGEKTF